MSTRKDKLLAEKAKNVNSISYHSKHIKRLEERNEAIDAEVESLKFREYGEICEAHDIEPEQLAELLKRIKRKEKIDEE